MIWSGMAACWFYQNIRSRLCAKIIIWPGLVRFLWSVQGLPFPFTYPHPHLLLLSCLSALCSVRLLASCALETSWASVIFMCVRVDVAVGVCYYLCCCWALRASVINKMATMWGHQHAWPPKHHYYVFLLPTLISETACWPGPLPASQARTHLLVFRVNYTMIC